MGQRLIVEIYDGDKRLANSYYHWSGYTCSSFEVSNNAINYYDEYLKDKSFFEDEYKNSLYKAIAMLEATGAGLLEGKDREMFEEIFPNLPDNMKIKDAVDRNCGLISIEEHSMDDSLGWAEALVTINIGSETVNFDAIYNSTLQEYYSDNIDYEMEKYEDSENKHIEADIKTLNEYYEEDKISKEDRDMFTKTLEEGEYKLIKIDDPYTFEGSLNLEDIPFDEYWELGEMLNKVYDSGKFCFRMSEDPDRVIDMIE